MSRETFPIHPFVMFPFPAACDNNLCQGSRFVMPVERYVIGGMMICQVSEGPRLLFAQRIDKFGSYIISLHILAISTCTFFTVFASRDDLEHLLEFKSFLILIQFARF
ncbi:hypothetical protein ANTQUA_LOCUS8640 [Anthophora quadrimaculata]